MRVTLLRHAHALDRSEWTQDDADRPLTAKGIARAEQLASEARFLIKAQEVWTSPMRRARHTAELVAARWAMPIREHAWLAEETSAPGQWAEQLASAATDVVLVGHEPDLGLFAAWAVGLLVPPNVPGLTLPKAAMCMLKGEPRAGGMEMQALVSAKVLRRLD